MKKLERDEPCLTEEDESILLELARRQRETSAAEALVVERLEKRVNMVQTIWKIGAAVITSIVLCTLYIKGIENREEADSKRIDGIANQMSKRFESFDTRMDSMRDKLTNLELALKDKANR